jgi:hypothetical protein
MIQTWTAGTVRELGVTTDVVTAGSVLGLSRNVSYQLVAAGRFPVRVLHLGSRYRIPVAALLKLLEIEPLEHAGRYETGLELIGSEAQGPATAHVLFDAKRRRA